jgi:hypothetical protein
MLFKDNKSETGWTEAITLEEWIIQEIEAGRQNEKPFQDALEFFGRAKFEKIWNEYKSRNKEQK